MKRGDVVIVVAPGELGKPRPAVIVQADELGDRTTSIIVCPLSSAVARPGRIRPVIEPAPANGLGARSQIMTDKLTALRRDRVRRAVGRLDADQLADLDRALLIVLGLAR